MHHFISGCDEKGIEKIRKMEEEDNLILIAYQESNYGYDKLPEEQLHKISELEKELGVKIIALKKNKFYL